MQFDMIYEMGADFDSITSQMQTIFDPVFDLDHSVFNPESAEFIEKTHFEFADTFLKEISRERYEKLAEKWKKELEERYKGEHLR